MATDFPPEAPQGTDAVGPTTVPVEVDRVVWPKYEVRGALLRWVEGDFVDLVDTTIHPKDCPCVSCKSRPEPIRQPYDELYLKQKADPWR
jgi:hypothetical protein